MPSTHTRAGPCPSWLWKGWASPLQVRILLRLDKHDSTTLKAAVFAAFAFQRCAVKVTAAVNRQLKEGESTVGKTGKAVEFGKGPGPALAFRRFELKNNAGAVKDLQHGLETLPFQDAIAGSSFAACGGDKTRFQAT
jgi:hypothetical protein